MVKINNDFKTIFIDIDGTLIRQVRFEDLDENKVDVLPGVKQKMDNWYEAGHHIVITTARPEDLRTITENQLKIAGIRYHQLVMGIGRKERYLINNSEKLTPEISRAIGISVKRDEGFENVEI
jgi:uncharacterized HAD superfamily protein